MKVAFLGNFRFPFTTETHIANTLEEMGHEVTRRQEDEFDWTPPEADLVMWQRTWGLDEEAQTRMLKQLERNNIPTVAIHLDRYWDLDREHQIHDLPWWRCRWVFSADGGNQERFKAAGVNHHWLRPAIYEAECRRGTKSSQYTKDVAFVGSFQHYHDEWPWRKELIRWLDATYRQKFRIWPRGRAVRGKQLSDLYASVKVVVGDSCFANTARNYWSDRPYETLGRGGFLLFPKVDGLNRDYEDNVHLRLYEVGDFKGLKELIDYYIQADDERNEIRTRGFEHTKRFHTYRHRMAEMLDVINGRPGLGDLIAVREGSMDGLVAREIFDENVYRFDPRELPPYPVVVDIGANVGTFSILAASHGAQVIAVEPLAENVERLKHNLNGHNVRIIEAGAGWSGEVETVGEGTGAYTRPGSGTPSLTLSELFIQENLTHVDFMKVDCEGCEYELFQDAPLDKIDRISMEFHSTQMRHRPIPEGLGELVTRLAEYGRVEIVGKPSLGGMLFWRRF